STGRVHRGARAPLLGRHPGPPRVQEPARAPGPAVPGVLGRGPGPGRRPQAPPLRPRARTVAAGQRRLLSDGPGGVDDPAPFTKGPGRAPSRGPAPSPAVGPFTAPAGPPFERDLVHHPGAVSVVPVTDDGHAVLVRQYRAVVDEHLLEIPAGKRDVAGEGP